MIQWALRALALDPEHLLAREFIAGAHWKKEDFDRYMTESVAHARAAGAPAELVEQLEAVMRLRGASGYRALRAADEPPPAGHAAGPLVTGNSAISTGILAP